MVGLTEHLSAKVFAHAVLSDDGTGDLGCTLQVVGCAGGDVLTVDLLGHATAHEDGHLVEHFLVATEHLVLVGDGQGIAKRTAAADDADLMHRIGMLKQVADQSMTAFVVSNGLLGVGVHDTALLFGTGDDALHGLGDLTHGDDLLAAACGKKSAFVHEVHQVGTREARGELSDLLKVDVGTTRFVGGMNLKNALAALDIGRVDGDLPVEAARAKQSRVKDVDTIGCGDKHNGIVLLEAVHLDEQLVQRLLALVMTAAQAGATLAADGVDLVDEDDGRRSFLCLSEQVANTACADADEHLDEVGTGNTEERHARLTCNGAREQRLTGTRRANQKAAARDLST